MLFIAALLRLWTWVPAIIDQSVTDSEYLWDSIRHCSLRLYGSLL